LINKHSVRCTICNSDQLGKINNDILNEVPKNMSLEQVGMKYGLTYKSILNHAKYLKDKTPEPVVETPILPQDGRIDSEEYLEGMLRRGDSTKVTGNALISAAKELASLRKNKDANAEEKELVLNALKGLEGFSEEQLDKYIGRVECLIEALKNSESTQTE